MRIAVTAASGQLGGAIVRALRRRTDVETIAVARTPAKAAGLGVEVRPGDYDDEAGMALALRGVDAVLMVSAMSPADVRIHQHRRVIDAARKAGVGHLVYTGIICGADAGGEFTAIQHMSRETERHLQASGMAWTIGRDSIYIEPDLEFVAEYARTGKISNCAGDGRCTYTSRDELAEAYACLLIDPRHRGCTYDLGGAPVTQAELAAAINRAFGTSLVYEPMSVEAYRHECATNLGGWLGGVIAGIYEGIQRGVFGGPSPYAEIVGRPHQTLDELIAAFRAERA